MADFRSLRDLLPSALGKLSEEAGQARGLSPLWAEVAGPGLAAQSVPATLSQGCLTIEVSEARWLGVLEEKAPVLLERLQAALGRARVTRMAFRVRPPGAQR